MAIQGELTQWKSYPTAAVGAMQEWKPGTGSTSANRYQWKGGGPHEEKNRDHRRETPANCPETTAALCSRLVRGLWQAGSNVDARSGGHNSERQLAHDLSAGGRRRDALPGNG